MARSIAPGLPASSDRLMIILAVVFAIVAAVLVFIVLSNAGGDDKKDSTPAAAGTVPVVTATGHIAANTRITESMLEVKNVPADLALANGYKELTGLVGLTTSVALAQGEQITKAKLGETDGNDDSLSLVVPPGLRGMSIPVKEERIVGGLLLAGDMVDVIMVMNGSSSTIVQDVEVLSVAQDRLDFVPPPIDSDTSNDGESSRGVTPDDAEAQPDADSVTLAVSLQQAQILALSSLNAELWLVIRARGDGEEVSIGAVDFGQIGIANTEESPVVEVAP